MTATDSFISGVGSIAPVIPPLLNIKNNGTSLFTEGDKDERSEQSTSETVSKSTSVFADGIKIIDQTSSVTGLEVLDVFGPFVSVLKLGADSITMKSRTEVAAAYKKELDESRKGSFKQEACETLYTHAQKMQASIGVAIGSDCLGIVGGCVPVVGSVPAAIVGGTVSVVRSLYEMYINGGLRDDLKTIADAYEKSNPITLNPKAFKKQNETITKHYSQTEAAKNKAEKAYHLALKAYNHTATDDLSKVKENMVKISAASMKYTEAQTAFEKAESAVKQHKSDQTDLEVYEVTRALIKKLEPKERSQVEQDVDTDTNINMRSWMGTEGAQLP